MKITKCRNCKGINFTGLFSFGKISFTGKFPKNKKIDIKKTPLEIIMCKNCKLIQLKHNYSLKYLYGPDYGYRTGINKTMKDHVKNITTTLKKIVKIRNRDLVLDIASNDSTLLNYYSKKNIRFGIDPLVNKYKKSYSNIDFKVSDFFSINKITSKTKQKFKIITALAVFYDLNEPNKFLKDVGQLIRDDGVVFIEFTDMGSMLKFNMFDAICHEHLTYFTSKIFCNIANKNNLRVFDIKFNSINGGSTQYFLCKKNSKFKTNQVSISRILKNEKKIKLESKETYDKFFFQIKKIKNKLNKIVLNAKRRKKIIHGYGASTKGNVLLQYFKISKKQIDYVADRNPKKSGCYTPGSKIPIISENSSRKLKPDLYLVLPWHFKKEILKREKKVIKNGSKFIFPLPNITINK